MMTLSSDKTNKQKLVLFSQVQKAQCLDRNLLRPTLTNLNTAQSPIAKMRRLKQMWLLNPRHRDGQVTPTHLHVWRNLTPQHRVSPVIQWSEGFSAI